MLRELRLVTKARLSDQRTERCGAPAITTTSDKSLPSEIREENLRSRRDSRISELKRQYLSGTYYVPASEISAVLVEKYLKR